MSLTISGALGKEFKSRTDLAFHQRMLQQQLEERNRRMRKDQVENEADDLMDFAVAAVTSIEVDEFRIELETYDAATIEALQENTIALDAVQAQLQDLMLQAHVLPDGRRVFKTEAGDRVFDEHGIELDLETIDPASIDDRKPRWETVKGLLDQRDQLDRERTELLDYQGELDAARERLDEGDLTRTEFDDLVRDIRADMPDAVKAHVPGMGPSQPEKPTASSAPELDISSDMVPDLMRPSFS